MGCNSKSGKFKVLTKYIGNLDLDNEQLCGQWIYFGEENGESNEPYELPYINYQELVESFVREFNEFSDNNPEYLLFDYCSILNNYGVKWN